MEQQIDFMAPEVQVVLPTLLSDKSTGRNIIWATDPPQALSPAVTDKSEMTPDQLRQLGFESIRARAGKQADTQQQRTRRRGEVCTPAWVCNKMNNALDADWFGREDVFNTEQLQGWQVREGQVEFPAPKGKTPLWQRYIDSRRLEITCGEAPFLASRYDAATGEMIPVQHRIGILDRKLRVVSEAVEEEKEWLYWAKRAVQATYGYEYQGDNLLLARTNLLLTFVEHLQARWQRRATTRELKTTANIIAWNVWQMDGLKRSIPGGKLHPDTEQLDLFSLAGAAEEQPPTVSCKVKNWRKGGHGTTQNFETIQEGSTSMKFDYVIGNPPYQDETLGDNGTFAPPVYNKFLDASYEVADKVEMIHPARFLFNAGSTPKAWNEKMLNDPHFKVLDYEADASKLFRDTDIKGGVVISYHDKKSDFGVIGHFIVFSELRSIVGKVERVNSKSLSTVIYAAESYRFTEKMHCDNPKVETLLSKGHKYDFKSNVLSKLDELIFFAEKPLDENEYIEILGLDENKRSKKWIKTEYVRVPENFESYKVFLSKANGSGAFGETLSAPVIGNPGVGHTQTFISIGKCNDVSEAQAIVKYIKTKFTRAMLGVLKITQDCPAPKWKYVPLQDFTAHSDIDWSKSVAEIDQQLYKKYDLSAEEIEFIETHVKEMV